MHCVLLAISLLIAIEDLLHKEVSILLIVGYSVMCLIQFLLLASYEPVNILELVTNNLIPILLMSGMILLGMTGLADVLYVVGTVLVFPKPIEISGISVIVSVCEPLSLTIAEVMMINSFSILLRKEGLDRAISRRSVVCLAASFLPFLWSLSLLCGKPERKIVSAPLIPYLQLGALIGLAFRQILI